MTYCGHYVEPHMREYVNVLKFKCLYDINTLLILSDLFQQVRYSHDITILLQPCVINLVTFFLYHDRIRLVRTTLCQV